MITMEDERMEVIVYSKSGCPECVFTKKFLEAENIKFVEKRVDLNQTYLEQVVALGYQSLPLVVVGNKDVFTGYQPDRIKALIANG